MMKEWVVVRARRDTVLSRVLAESAREAVRIAERIGVRRQNGNSPKLFAFPVSGHQAFEGRHVGRT